jgi:hypothetical protein
VAGHGDRVGVQVQQATATRRRRRQVAQVVEPQLAAHRVAQGRQPHERRPVLQRERAHVRAVHHLLDTRYRARREESEQRLAVERLAARQAQLDRAGALGAAAPARPPTQLAGSARVDASHRVVELPHAPEAGAGGDLGERQLGRLDQRARRLRSLCTRERHRPGPQLGHEDAVQVPL